MIPSCSWRQCRLNPEIERLGEFKKDAAKRGKEQGGWRREMVQILRSPARDIRRSIPLSGRGWKFELGHLT
jgi:hypothetical protein